MSTREAADAGTPPRRTPTTIATIAAHMGLSRATITHVLNGRAAEQRIHPETQRRVLEVARELGYRPNTSARAIRAGRFGSIALVQSLFGQYLPRELLYGLTAALADKDLHLVLSQVPDVAIKEESYLPHTMRELSADGLLVYRHVGFSASFLEQIRQMRIPAIFLNAQQEFDAIYPDDLMGGRLAAEFLLRLGHERIAYVDSEQRHPEWRHYSNRDRRAGYEQAMQSAGRAPQVHLLPHDWRADGQEAGTDRRVESARALLAQPGRPTAVLAYELTEAMAVVHAANLLGQRIPRDLSIVLFHNRIEDRYFLPFHTMSNQMAELGRGAVAMLLAKIQDPEASLPSIAVPEALLEGATCAEPPG
jgi:DNA-binding LacI/PurR family transcriptional regulator